MEIDKQALGEKHPSYAVNLANLARFYDQLGNYSKAEPLLLQAMQIRREVLGDNHPDYASSLDDLAGRSTGAWATTPRPSRSTAKPWRSASRCWARTTPTMPTSLHNLAALYKDMGDYAKAEPLYRQALEIHKRMLGENHPDYATSLNNLAALYQAMGDLRQGRAALQAGAGDREAVAGRKTSRLCHQPEQPGRACTRTWATTPRPSRSTDQALEITKQALGENHPDYATSLNNLAVLYVEMGDYAKAEPLCRQALEIQQGSAGRKSPRLCRQPEQPGRRCTMTWATTPRPSRSTRQALEDRKASHWAKNIPTMPAA